MLLLVQHAVLHQHHGGRWAGFFKGMAAYSALNAAQLVAMHSGEGGAARASGSSVGGRPDAPPCCRQRGDGAAQIGQRENQAPTHPFRLPAVVFVAAAAAVVAAVAGPCGKRLSPATAAGESPHIPLQRGPRGAITALEDVAKDIRGDLARKQQRVAAAATALTTPQPIP